jgi:hypothetical protein
MNDAINKHNPVFDKAKFFVNHIKEKIEKHCGWSQQDHEAYTHDSAYFLVGKDYSKQGRPSDVHRNKKSIDLYYGIKLSESLIAIRRSFEEEQFQFNMENLFKKNPTLSNHSNYSIQSKRSDSDDNKGSD